ncbi:hypothetical protein [Streptomyces sp. NRRL S-37]|nr:hypothetical protein [Streptomyces sp. NRRL S-37]
MDRRHRPVPGLVVKDRAAVGTVLRLVRAAFQGRFRGVRRRRAAVMGT